jgi:hypothetical protein
MAPGQSARHSSLVLAAALAASVSLVGCATGAATSSSSAAAPAPMGDMSTTAPSPDPRIGLRAGLADAGQATWNMRLLANAPSPAPFNESLNSDLAFIGPYAIQGNFNGYQVWDISNPASPALKTSFVCPASQSDVSVYRNLLFVSGEGLSGRLDCGTQGVRDTVSKDRLRGVRIFDISDITKPKQIAAIQSCRGSHTHTLVTDPGDKANIYVYGSGTGAVRAGDELEGCSSKGPDEDANTALFSIDVIKVPLAAPEKAAIVNRPRIFADPKSGRIAGLWQGGNHGEGTQSSRITNQCHDITVFPEVGLAAGACAGNGILMDISDPVHPVRLDQVTDKNFAYWHSATFNNDGTKVIFTDEWGGGTQPRCRATDPPTWGADAVFDIVDKKLQFGGYFKLPAPQGDNENCVAHNGSIIPVPGRDIMVQAWYQGGVSVFDFTDSAKPIEIAYFDRGPIDEKNLILGGYWSTYWYNGRIYGSEISRGIDIFRLLPSEYMTQNEIDAASSVRLDVFNPQMQPKITWPPTVAVARAYLDQLTRSRAIDPARAAAVKSALDKVEKDNAPKAAVDQLDTLAQQIESGASAASGRDAARLRALAATLKGRAARLRS